MLMIDFIHKEVYLEGKHYNYICIFKTLPQFVSSHALILLEGVYTIVHEMLKLTKDEEAKFSYTLWTTIFS